MSGIFSDFARCLVEPPPLSPGQLALQCAACRDTANRLVVSELQEPWQQMEDRYIKLDTDIQERVDQFETVREEAQLVFGLEPGDPIDQTVQQAIAQRAAVLRALKMREFFEASCGKMSPFSVSTTLVCPLGSTTTYATSGLRVDDVAQTCS